MIALNSVIVLCALATLQFATARASFDDENLQVYNGSHVYWGSHALGENDRLQNKMRVKYKGLDDRPTINGTSSDCVKYAFIGKITVDIDLPTNTRGLGRPITFIEMLNIGRSDGEARITKGGIGYMSVSIRLETDYNKDVDFFINLYG